MKIFKKLPLELEMLNHINHALTLPLRLVKLSFLFFGFRRFSVFYGVVGSVHIGHTNFNYIALCNAYRQCVDDEQPK